ncbi:RNA polymerase sigma factor [Deminuibacter soli]|nr:sigma-70 family RNA polymerase sigma factor [Deminuibacter soli]
MAQMCYAFPPIQELQWRSMQDEEKHILRQQTDADTREHIAYLKVLFLNIAAGDAVAYKELFDLYKQRIFTAAYKMTRSQSLSEEVLQDVFLNIWACRTSLVHVERPGAYLYRIIFTSVVRYLKKRGNEARLAELALLKTKKHVNETEERMAGWQTEKLIQKAIATLPPQKKLVYKMRQEQGLQYAEIARQLKIASGTVQNHFHEAIRLIRLYISKHSVMLVAAAMLCSVLCC